MLIRVGKLNFPGELLPNLAFWRQHPAKRYKSASLSLPSF